MSLATGRSIPKTDTGHAGFRDQSHPAFVQRASDGARPAREAQPARKPRGFTGEFPGLCLPVPN